MTMPYKSMFSLLLLLLFGCAICEYTWGKVIIHARTAVNIELTGYNSLAQSSIFKGQLAAGNKFEIDTPYCGLALLNFTSGHVYPVIIGTEPFTLKIENPAEPPSFENSGENDLFYNLMAAMHPKTNNTASHYYWFRQNNCWNRVIPSTPFRN